MINERIKHGGRAITTSRMYNIPLNQILDFSSNTNPLGYSKRIDKLKIEDFNLSHFPDDNYSELIETISNKFKCNINNVLVGNGTTEIIRIISHAFINKKTKIAIPKNTYEEYAYSTRLSKGQVMPFNFSLSSNISFLCNPNNPTGDIIERKDILKFLDNYNGLLILDESYIEFVDNEESFSLSRFIDKYDNLVILRSLSKFYGLPGIRLGYCLANQNVINELDKWRISWNVNSFAAKIGIISLNDKKFKSKSKRFVSKERKFFFNSLKDFQVNDSATTFFLITVENSEKLTHNLEKEGILIRDCYSFGLKNNIRVSFRKREENNKLLKVLREEIL